MPASKSDETDREMRTPQIDGADRETPHLS
jgi:hypothetical protein